MRIAALDPFDPLQSGFFIIIISVRRSARIQELRRRHRRVAYGDDLIFAVDIVKDLHRIGLEVPVTAGISKKILINAIVKIIHLSLIHI